MRKNLETYCIDFLNSLEGKEKVTVTLEDKIDFKLSIQLNHKNGFYIIRNKHTNKFSLTNVNPTTLETHIRTLDKMVESVFIKL